jgi:hypothetical protein
MPSLFIDTSDAAILSRVLEPNKTTFSPATAREILAMDFQVIDKVRMRRLSAKARAGTLTSDEESAIDNYERVGHLLNIIQSKARRSLKRGRRTNHKPESH